MSDVRTFRADSMQEALQLVRAEMGGEAVILHTRQFEHRRLLPWLRPRQEVEITAGLGVNVRPVAGRAREAHEPTAATAGHPLAASNGSTTEPPTRQPAPRNQPLPEPAIPAASQTAARSPAPVAERFDFRMSKAESPSTAPAWMGIRDVSPIELRTPPPSAYAASVPPPPTYSSGSAASLASLAHAPSPTIVRDAEPTAVTRQLEAIQRMLETLGPQASVRRSDDVPAELHGLYTELVNAEVEADIARELVFRLRQNCTASQLADPHASWALLTALIESELRCCDPIAVSRGRRKVVALVGSTGVGKTTTIAKLAANFRLRDGIRMGLLTVDTYRIAAVEQLRTYAEIIDLPMRVVTSPLDMRRALDELAGLDLVLIDTAGRSPRDDLQIQELKRLLVEARVDEVHLVLSLTASLKSLEAAIAKFSAANITSLILTKVDEASGAGALLGLTRRVGIPISYLATGQGVPEDIEPARPARLARLVLGEDRLR